MSRDNEPGRYLASKKLVSAVNAALAIQRPLLIAGDPGTGKSALAWSIATELGIDKVLEFRTSSESQSRDVLYSFDYLRRLFDANSKDERAKEPHNYVTFQALGEAIATGVPCVVLIDEIDKAPRDFPNDLLNEIDRMRFRVRETGREYPEPGKPARRPIVVITSNSEQQLPDAFLRRCVFHYIDFPDKPDEVLAILHERIPQAQQHKDLLDVAIKRFLELRQREGLEHKPATAEVIDWIKILIAEKILPQALLETAQLHDLPGLSALSKTRHDTEQLKDRSGTEST